ncbi:MAG: type II toxin-antitoxin system prevent-host-death family antitoxin [Actinomycetaceae bacterium]|nr:type II toxin-antitoxin system prevent-host-death family antitoxin [Actinomycetaceae bacterium]
MASEEQRVSLRELNQASGRIIAGVKGGRPVTITERGKPVARIVPIEEESHIERLIADGLIRRAKAKDIVFPPRIESEISVAQLLAEDRSE